MIVRLRYFAWVREAIGCDAEELPLETRISVAAMLERLAQQSPGHAAALADPGRIRAAINEQFVGWDAMLAPGDELALFPPMTGG